MDQKRFQECRSQLMERIEVTRDLSDAEIYAIIDELIEERGNAQGAVQFRPPARCPSEFHR